MSDVGDPAGRARTSSRARLLLIIALAGLVVAAVAGRLFSALSARAGLPGLSGPSGLSGLSGGALAQLLAFVVVWVPLVAAVVVASLILGRGRVWRFLSLGFHPLDLFWGFAAGCLARAADAFVNLGLDGVTGLTPQPLLGDPRRGLAVAVAILAPVVLAPLIEEVFFRGLLQGSLVGVLRGGVAGTLGGRVRGASSGASETGQRSATAAAPIVAVVVTAALFAVLHLAVGDGLTSTATVTLIGTFVFGLLAGALTAATGRIGGALVAHIVFNGIAVYLTWPG